MIMGVKNKINPFFQVSIRRIKVKHYICSPLRETEFIEKCFIKYRFSVR